MINKKIATLSALVLLCVVCIILNGHHVMGASPGSISFGISNCNYMLKRHVDPTKLAWKDSDKRLIQSIINKNKVLREAFMITEEEVDKINWEEYMPKQEKRLLTNSKYLSGCARVTLPLLWDDSSNSKTIKGYIQKYVRVKDTTLPKVQLWMLQGGPGGSGSALYRIAEMLVAYFDAKDTLNPIIYVPDHRGTGYSSYLSCNKFYKAGNSTVNVQVGLGPAKDQESCWREIVNKYPNGELKGWGTSAAARDILYYIEQEKIKEKTTKTFVYGVSYGTYWLNRILTLEPMSNTTIDGAIADSVVKPTMDFLDRDLHFEEAATYFMDVCTKSKDCLGRFGGNFKTTEEMMKSVYEDMDKSTCGPLSSRKVGYVSSSFLTNTDLRRMIFPIFYRYQRCGIEDKIFISLLNGLLEQSFPESTAEALAKKHRLSLPFALWPGAELDMYYHTSVSINLEEDMKPVVLNAKKVEESIPSYQRQQNNNIFVLIASSEITNRNNIKSVSYWEKRYNSVPPYVNGRLSPSLTLNYNIVKRDLYNETLDKSYSNFNNKRILTLHCDTDPQTPKSFATNWFSHYNKGENIMYPNCVHGAIISTLYKKDIAKKVGVPTLGMDNIISFLTEEPIKKSFDDLYDNVFQFDAPYNIATIFPIQARLLCFSLYDDCIPRLRGILIAMLVIGILCCSCCLLLCIISILTCIYCCVKKNRDSKNTSAFVRFDDDTSHASIPQNQYPPAPDQIYQPPNPNQYAPNPNPYPL